MEEENNRKTFKLWLYLTPLFILAAWPALRWRHKANSSELNLSKDEATAFNSENGEIRKTVVPKTGKPDFDYGIMGVRYKSKDGATEAANVVDAMKAKEQRSSGYIKGYLSYAMGKVINNPKAVGAILNNKNVISGFMSRGTVKDATASPEGLANYLKSGGPAAFINNPMVKAAMSNPAVVSTVASSGLVSAMLETPAAKALMNDPQALRDLAASNPELAGMIMANPNTTNLMNNPDVTDVTKKFDTSGIKRP